MADGHRDDIVLVADRAVVAARPTRHVDAGVRERWGLAEKPVTEEPDHPGRVAHDRRGESGHDERVRNHVG
jgi:hypothetical protein